MRYAVLTLAVLAVASWYAHRHRKATYHRRRWHHANCHARATRMHRIRLAGRWVLSLRITIAPKTRTAC